MIDHIAYLSERGSDRYIASAKLNRTAINRCRIDDRDRMFFPFYNKTKANCFLIDHGNRMCG